MSFYKKAILVSLTRIAYSRNGLLSHPFRVGLFHQDFFTIYNINTGGSDSLNAATCEVVDF